MIYLICLTQQMTALELSTLKRSPLNISHYSLFCLDRTHWMAVSKCDPQPGKKRSMSDELFEVSFRAAAVKVAASHV